VIHQPISILLQCLLNAWLKGLASGDQYRLAGSGSGLEACLQCYTNPQFSLVYFKI